MSSIFRTNGIPESRSQVTATVSPIFHQTSLSSVYGLAYFFLSFQLKPCSQGWVMGFVGDGGNIAITTALLPSFCALYCKHQIVFGILYLIFYACLRLQFLDVETNPGLWCPVPTVCRLH